MTTIGQFLQSCYITTFDISVMELYGLMNLLKPMGMISVAYFINIVSHEQSLSNQVCCFHLFLVFFASNRFDLSEFVVLYQKKKYLWNDKEYTF